MKTATIAAAPDISESPIRKSNPNIIQTVIAARTASRIDDPTTRIRRSMLLSSLTTRSCASTSVSACWRCRSRYRSTIRDSRPVSTLSKLPTATSRKAGVRAVCNTETTTPSSGPNLGSILFLRGKIAQVGFEQLADMATRHFVNGVQC